MREDDDEVEHVCRFCDKSFPSGRQLGGHMRSHQNHSSYSFDADSVGNKKRRRRRDKGSHDKGENSDGRVGGSSMAAYVLRENPRKSWRITEDLTEDVWLDRDKSSRECGRGFGSWKALFGHMMRHAPEDQDSRTVDEQGEVAMKGWEDRAWDDEDEEEVDVAVTSRRRRSERRKRYMVAAASSSSLSLVNNINKNVNDDDSHIAGSSVSEIDQEQEEVAMCLMMLSRDAGHRKATDSIIPESSKVKRTPPDAENGTDVIGKSGLDNLAVENEVQFPSKVHFPDFGSAKESNSLQGSQMDPTEAKVAKNIGRKRSLSSDLNDSELGMKTRKEFADDEYGLALLSGVNSDKRNRFECTTCNRVFHSYQALGGHKASHSKIKNCFNGNIICETEIFPLTNMRKTTQKRVDRFSGKKHVCPVCHKEFPSGQALGGHKRSHMQPTNDPAKGTSMAKPVTITRDAFDLNLPAQLEDEGSSQLTFSSWHSLSHHEAITGFSF